MFIQTGTIGIIADDLTGANDTALQFNLSGANTQILFDYSQAPENISNTQVWAISTETRNLSKENAIRLDNGQGKIQCQRREVWHHFQFDRNGRFCVGYGLRCRFVGDWRQAEG